MKTAHRFWVVHRRLDVCEPYLVHARHAAERVQILRLGRKGAAARCDERADGEHGTSSANMGGDSSRPAFLIREEDAAAGGREAAMLVAMRERRRQGVVRKMSSTCSCGTGSCIHTVCLSTRRECPLRVRVGGGDMRCCIKNRERPARAARDRPRRGARRRRARRVAM